MKREKFLIIVPPNITFEGFRRPRKNTKSWRHANGEELGVIITDVPLGAITISAWLKEKFDAEVKVLDFNILLNKTWDNPDDQSFGPWFESELEKLDFKPDIVGFSSLFVTGYLNLLALGNICTRRYPDAMLIGGGNVPTTMYREIFSDDNGGFRALCHGEGEIPLQELIQSDNREEYLESSDYWVTRNKLEKGRNFQHKFIQELDEIPELDYDAIDLRDYHHSPTIKAYTQISDKENYVTYMTSRGCPFLCTFCAAHTVHGRKMRYFSLDRIHSELEKLVDRYNVKTLVLEDDHFLSDKKRALQILSVARTLGLVCVFPNALALYALDREMLESLAATGVHQLTLAVESGSKRVLKQLMKKPLRVDIIHRVAADCWDLGIYTDCNIIIGMPGETLDDLEESREFLKTVRANWYRINVATPLAGSEMYIDAVNDKQIVGDIREAGYKSCVVKTDHFGPEEINNIAYDLNLELNFVNNQDMKAGNFERAAESFQNVLKLKEDHPFAKYYLGKCLVELRKNEEGEKLISQALETLNNDPSWGEPGNRLLSMNGNSEPVHQAH